MAQLTVTQFATPIARGQRGTPRPSDVTRAGPVTGSDNIRLGDGVVMSDSVDFGLKLPSAATGQIIAGIAYDSGKTMYALTNNPDAPVYAPGDICPVIERGSCGVVCEQNVTAGTSKVFLRFTEAGGNLKGSWRTSSGETVAVWRLAFTGTPATESVAVNGVTVSDSTGDLNTFASLIAAQSGVASAVLSSTHIDVTGTTSALTLASASVTGVGASVALTNPTAGVAAIAFEVANARWLTSGTAGDVIELEINKP